MKEIIRPIWLIIRAKRMKKLAEEWRKLTTLDSLSCMPYCYRFS